MAAIEKTVAQQGAFDMFFDRQLERFVPGTLVGIAGRPGTGKTAVAINLAIRAAESGKRVGYVSLEMSDAQLDGRFRAAFATPEQGECDVRSRLILLTPDRFTPRQLQAQLKNSTQDDRPDVVIIDYLQLMGGPERPEKMSRSEELAEFVKTLRRIAVDFSLTVVLITQVARKADRREDISLELADLRRLSPGLDEEADVILLLIREETRDADSAHRGELEIHLAKNRAEAPGRHRLGFDRTTGRFE